MYMSDTWTGTVQRLDPSGVVKQSTDMTAPYGLDFSQHDS